MPLLPDNFTSSHSASTFEPTETVRKPEISLMTAEVGEVVSALSEVDGGKAADALGLMKEGEDGGGKEGEKGTFRVVWEGVLDDLFGERRK